MPVPERSPVLELPFPPDDYLCTWHVPGLDNTTVHLPGIIELRESRPPFGRLYGDLPLVSVTKNNGSVTSFPQEHDYSVVRATLANGGELVVLNAQVTWWPGSGSVRGAAVAVRRRSGGFLMPASEHPEAKTDEDVTFTRLRFQVGALDAVLGVRPIGEKSRPPDQNGDRTWSWSVKTNPATPTTWTGTDDELVGAYAAKVNTFDFYNVSIRFAPVLNVSAPPQTLFELVSRYVEPVRAIASIATGKSQPITHLMLGRTEDPTHRRLSESDADRDGDAQEPTPYKVMPTWQIYGTGLQQTPYESDGETVREQGSVLFCGEDGVDLLALIHAWWRLTEEHHPLIETYAGMLHAQDQHPRSRFLLLIQSLEGMYGHETKEDYETHKSEHRARRIDTLDRVHDRIERADYRFIKDNLSRDPQRNLESALTWSFKSHTPTSVVEERLAATSLVKVVAAENKCSTVSAVRIARNALAHGTRGFDAQDLDPVNEILDRVVRAHALRLLGCDERVTDRLFGDGAR